MKNLFKLLSITAIVIFTVLVLSCDEESDLCLTCSKDPCSCGVSEPDLCEVCDNYPCDCACECEAGTIHWDGNGLCCDLPGCGENCIFENTPTFINLGSAVPITGATEQEMVDQIAKIQAVFNELDPDVKEELLGEIIGINIIGGNNVELIGGVLHIGKVATASAIQGELEEIELALGACVCEPGTLRLIGEDAEVEPGCAKYCTAEQVKGVRAVVGDGIKATNGIPITNRENVDNFDTMITRITGSVGLDHDILSSEARQNFIKNNIKEIRIVERIEALVVHLIIKDGVLIVDHLSSGSEVRIALRNWLEAQDPPVLNVMLPMDNAIRLAEDSSHETLRTSRASVTWEFTNHAHDALLAAIRREKYLIESI